MVAFDILHKSLFSGHRLLHLPYCSTPPRVQPCHAAPATASGTLCSTGVISHGDQVTHRQTSDFQVPHMNPQPTASPAGAGVAVAPFLVWMVCSPFRAVLAQGMLAVKY